MSSACKFPTLFYISTHIPCHDKNRSWKTKSAFRLNFISETHLFGGGDKGSRTPDLLNAIETLYQLSYIPMNSKRQILSHILVRKSIALRRCVA